MSGFSWPALLAALGAAAGYALSASLQHRACPEKSATTRGPHRLLAKLAGRPWWLLGLVIAFASFGLHAFALHLGSLAVVQPVVVSGVVLAVPVRASLARRWPSARELGTVAMTASGLALLLVVADPTVGRAPVGPGPAIMVTVCGVVTAVLAAGCADRWGGDERAALLYGIASGVLFGLVAGLLKLTVLLLASTSHPLDLLGSWTTWAVVALGTAGVITTQRGYTAAGMSSSMPVLNVTDVVVALLFGAVVFHQVPAHDPVALVGELLAAGLVVVGLRRLALDDGFAPDPPHVSDQHVRLDQQARHGAESPVSSRATVDRRGSEPLTPEEPS
ncbi:MAG: hypothetical protein JWR42_389 [Marmoricola sp.]|nr:hypothetical protein [Marmoricola sp.]